MSIVIRPRWWERLNKTLLPYMGPAQLGPYGEPPLPPTSEKACPLCGQRMAVHTFDRSQDHTATRMYCPHRTDATSLRDGS